MKRIWTIVAGVLLAVGTVSAQVSDETVIQLLQQYKEEGLTQEQVLKDLTDKGISQEQMRRLKTQYESTLQPATRHAKEAPTYRRSQTSDFIFDSIAIEPDKRDTTEIVIFGRNIFRNKELTFAPNLNLPTPDNYVLGSGDEINIVIWGTTETTIPATVTPEGRVLLTGVGPVALSGLTVRQATAQLRRVLGRIYGGLNTGDAQMKVTLSGIRSIQVHVMGEIETPGTYTLPSLATVFHVLHVAGGVNPTGSLRSIKVFRDNREVADADVYEFILEGTKLGDIVLQDGDVVLVSPYQMLVDIKGGVKRPMRYELRTGETLDDLIRYAGDFTSQAYRSSINVVRQNERELQVFNVPAKKTASFVMQDGDVATIGTMLARFDNKVEIQGAVYKEGVYAIDDTLRTVRDLVAAAEGVREDAFLDRALLQREKEDWTAEMEAINLGKVLRGEAPDLPLRKNDVLYIPSKFDLKEKFEVEILGPVTNPGLYSYADGMTIEDLIIKAGGLRESASTVKVDVSRRIKNPRSLQYGPHRSMSFTVSVKDSLEVEGEPGFRLEPYDQVYVRKSPIYNKQNSVAIEGEVVFEGVYPLSERLVKVSDIITKAGGLTPYAFVEGARLERRMTYEERNRINNMVRILGQQITNRDSISLAQLDMQVETYPVGFDLTKALNQPGSASDVVLQAGDRIIIPEYNGTVRIAGAVMYPNAIVYQKGKKLRDYIRSAGGFSSNARHKKVFVVYMNGMIETGLHAEVRPGCEIIVPMRNRGSRTSMTEILSMTSTTASLAAVIASIGSLFR